MGPLSKIWHSTAAPLVAVLLTGFVVTGSFTFFREPKRDPHSNLTLKVLTPAIMPGEPLRVRAGGFRNKMCVVFLARSYKNLNTNVVLAKESAPGGFSPLGEWSEDIDLKMPFEMIEGDYQLRIIQNNDCGDEVFPIMFPTVTFAIISHR